MMKFQVKRATWHRGDISGSALARNDGTMCCLGHLGLALGYTFDKLFGKLMPANVCVTHKEANKWQGLVTARDPNIPFFFNSRECNNIAKVNDNIEITDLEREESLTELFKEAGFEVEFVD